MDRGDSSQCLLRAAFAAKRGRCVRVRIHDYSPQLTTSNLFALAISSHSTSS